MRLQVCAVLAFLFAVLPASAATETEMLFWQSVNNSKSAADYQAYLSKYPKGEFAELARARIATLSRPQPAAPQSAPARQASGEPPPECMPAAEPGTHTLPPYPSISARLGEQGTTSLTIFVSRGGDVTGGRVRESSGSQRLDAAALEYVRSNWEWRAVPDSCQMELSGGIALPVSVRWSLRDAE